MALRAIMLRERIKRKKEELARCREKEADFAKREKELETAIGEAETDEEQAEVEKQVESLEREKEEHGEAVEKLEQEIREAEEELKKAEEEPPERRGQRTGRETGRKERRSMGTRRFFGLAAEERDAFFADEEVRGFLERTRELGRASVRERRAVTGTELTIPTVVLDLIRQNVTEYSKMAGRVRLVPVSGNERQTVMGSIPEAVWTEMCAKLNEIDFGFTQTEVDGYKVGGVIYICEATLEDSDYNLASEIIQALGIAIGIALDKAILYGYGTKMPLGIVTRLAQTEEPSDYPANARPWENLSTTNLITIPSAKSGLDFYKEIVKAGGKIKGKYARGTKFWAMNDTTYTALKVEAMTFNSSGAIVAVQSGTMPVAGGDIIILSDEIIPDGNIIAGYGELYLLAERAGSKFARSDEYRFAEDQVAFKGTARYDGEPVIAEGFIAIGIGSAPVTSATFTGDTANDATLERLEVGSEELSPAFAAGKYAYTVAAKGTTAKIKAIPTQDGAKVAITYAGKKILNGEEVELSGTKTLSVKVKNGLGEQRYNVEITK